MDSVPMDVDTVLAERQGRYKTTEVHKEVELQLDVGNLLASDLNTIDIDALRSPPSLSSLTCYTIVLTQARQGRVPEADDEGQYTAAYQ